MALAVCGRGGVTQETYHDRRCQSKTQLLTKGRRKRSHAIQFPSNIYRTVDRSHPFLMSCAIPSCMLQQRTHLRDDTADEYQSPRLFLKPPKPW